MDKSKIRSYWDALGNRRYVLALLVLVVAAGLFWGWYQGGQQPVNAGEISIEALQEDATGINPATSFLIKTENQINPKTITENLQINPSFTYDLKQRGSGNEFELIPREKLAAGTVYRFALDLSGHDREDLSWAFQTKSRFRVVNTLPADQAYKVPVNTGIELNFSHENYDIDSVAKNFSISPKVEGRFEQHKKSLVFVPKKELKAGTIYTVKLGKGVALTGSKETLEQDCIFRFETDASSGDSEGLFFEVQDYHSEFSTSQAPYFPVYYLPDAGKTSSVQIELWRYPSYKEYRAAWLKKDEIAWSYYARLSYREKTDGLLKGAKYDTKFVTDGMYNDYVSFPEQLAAGFYLAEITAGGRTQQIRFQVSDLAVYRASNEKGTLFWVNDMTTRKPASGAQVIIESKQLKFECDGDGVALIKKNLMDARADFALVRSGSKELLVPLEEERSDWIKDGLKSQEYWKYLYLDRELYQPGDTVNYWGVIAGRSEQSPDPKEITLELWGGGYYYEDERKSAPILKQKIDVRDRSFSGSIKLPVLKPGYYYLELKVGNTRILGRGLSVATYQKPAYQLTLTPDRTAAMAGEKVNFKVAASFYEGTPVPGLVINYQTNNGQGKVTCNESGEAVIPITAYNYDGIDSGFCFQFVDVRATLPEAGEINASSSIMVFPSRVMLKEEKIKTTGKTFSFQATLRKIDLSKVKSYEDLAKEKYLAGPVAGSPVKVRLLQEVWTKKETGQRYDFITKKVEKIYEYTRSEKLVNELTLATDSNGAISYQGELQPDSNYFLDTVALDEEGREYRRRTYVNLYNPENWEYKYYHLKTGEDEKGYQPNERVVLTLMENDQEVRPSGKNILFLRGQSEIESYTVSSEAEYTFIFTRNDIPNTNVCGVYFDGTSFKVTAPRRVMYDSASQGLTVKVKTDKKVYRPGEKASLSVEVTDRAGLPVSGARVNLNLVDEALYQLEDQYVDLLGSLYNDGMDLYLSVWFSNYHPMPGGAEQGGEGGSSRTDFRDTALFTTLKTGSNGRAQTEIQLPDNLTSWRITYHAITQDLKAASGTAQIPVKLPFFVDVIAQEAYLVGDSPGITLRGYGTGLKGGSQVLFKMTLTTPGGKKLTETTKATAFTPVIWQLPKLEAGSYSYTITATGGGHRDSLTRKFSVVKSFQERNVTDLVMLEPGVSLKGSSQEPTTLVFCDYEKSQYLNALTQLAWMNGERLELKLAGHRAHKLLQKYFPEQAAGFGESDAEFSLVNYQRPDGGISILPYASSDPAVSALVAAVAPEEFDRQGLIGYFYRCLEDDTTDQSIALLGLAALGEPVLVDIKYALQQKDLSPESRIYLTLALLEMGDGANASGVYRELLDKYGQDLGTTIRINTGRDQDEILAATARMAMLAARTNQPEKNKLYQYLLENPGKDILNTLEQLQILEYCLRYMDPAPAAFTYTLKGETVTRDFEGDDAYTLTLVPADLKKITFSNIKGKVGVWASYTAPFSQDGMQDQDLALERSYYVNQKKTTSFNRTDLVKVVITPHIGERAPAGLYEVVDVLPAGLAYVNKPYIYTQDQDLWKNISYPSEVKGQKVSFAVWGDERPITYYARVVAPGEFTSEPAVLSHMTSTNVYTVSKQDRIVIK